MSGSSRFLLFGNKNTCGDRKYKEHAICSFKKKTPKKPREQSLKQFPTQK